MAIDASSAIFSVNTRHGYKAVDELVLVLYRQVYAYGQQNDELREGRLICNE